MNVWRQVTFRYALYGMLVGALFPLTATIVDMWQHGLPLAPMSAVLVQRTQALHWMIDTAPLFLGIFAAIAGHRQGQLEQSYRVLAERGRSLEAALHKAERAEELVRLNAENAQLYAQTRQQLASLERFSIDREQHLEEIRQLTLPLIPITDDILVLPLIGEIDTARLALLQTQVLERVVTSRTRVLILDCTGVGAMAADAVPGISRLLNALALLGKHTIVTEIRPSLAQQLVERGAGHMFQSIATNLAAGVRLAEHVSRRD